MTMAMAEESGLFFHKNFSEWWSEETENVFQRLERWAAYARGYNRLRSQRLSRGRMSMYEEQEPSWIVSSPIKKPAVNGDSWPSHFQPSKRSKASKSQPEATKLNCCGTFSYKSNSKLDSNCLETYSYDHSIYFKTIGDIRNGKRDLSESPDSNRNSVINNGIHEDRNDAVALDIDDLGMYNEDEAEELELAEIRLKDDEYTVHFTAPWSNKQARTVDDEDRRTEYEIEGLFSDDNSSSRLKSDDNNNVVGEKLEWCDFQLSTLLTDPPKILVK